jgi:hypothetical protein
MNQRADTGMVNRDVRLRSVDGRRLWAGRSQFWVAEAQSVNHVRRFGKNLTTAWGMSADCVWNAREVVSELATNAVVHQPPISQGLNGESPTPAVMWVTWLLFSDCVRIEVEDDSDEKPQLLIVDNDAETGRGLSLVELWCERWGCDLFVGGGKRVWGEVAR